MSGDRDPNKSQHGLNEDRHQDKVALRAQHRCGVSKDKGTNDITGCLLRHSNERGKCDLLWLTLEHFQDWHALDALLIEHLLKDRGLGDAEPDPQPDPD